MEQHAPHRHSPRSLKAVVMAALRLFGPYIYHAPKGRLLMLIGLIGAGIAANIGLPFVWKAVYGHAEQQGSTVWLWALLGMFAFMWYAQKSLLYLQKIILFPITNTAIRDIKSRLGAHMQAIPYTELQKIAAPEILAAAKRVSLSARSYIHVLCLGVLTTLGSGLSGTVVLFKVNPRYGVVFFLGFAGTLWVTMRCMAWYVAIRRQAWAAADRATGRLHDTLAHTLAVRAAGPKGRYYLDTSLQHEARWWLHANTRQYIAHLIINACIALAFFGGIGWCAWHVLNGQTQAYTLLLLHGQFVGLIGPLRRVLTDWISLAEGAVDVQRVEELLAMPEENAATINRNVSRDSLLFEEDIIVHLADASLERPRRGAVVRPITITITDGDYIWLSGPTGAGKSSLAHMLAGVYPPSTGGIYIRDLGYAAHHRAGTVAQHVILVPQDAALLTERLRANLTFGLGNVSSDRLSAVIKDFALDGLVRHLPQGLDTHVGTRGHWLSGGECQRVLMAHAALRGAQLLILDETTNALDPDMMQTVLNAARKWFPALLVIAHDRHAATLCNQHWYMADGQLYTDGYKS